MTPNVINPFTYLELTLPVLSLPKDQRRRRTEAKNSTNTIRGHHKSAKPSTTRKAGKKVFVSRSASFRKNIPTRVYKQLYFNILNGIAALVGTINGTTAATRPRMVPFICFASHATLLPHPWLLHAPKPQ